MVYIEYPACTNHFTECLLKKSLSATLVRQELKSLQAAALQEKERRNVSNFRLRKRAATLSGVISATLSGTAAFRASASVRPSSSLGEYRSQIIGIDNATSARRRPLSATYNSASKPFQDTGEGPALYDLMGRKVVTQLVPSSLRNEGKTPSYRKGGSRPSTAGTTTSTRLSNAIADDAEVKALLADLLMAEVGSEQCSNNGDANSKIVFGEKRARPATSHASGSRARGTKLFTVRERPRDSPVSDIDAFDVPQAITLVHRLKMQQIARKEHEMYASVGMSREARSSLKKEKAFIKTLAPTRLQLPPWRPSNSLGTLDRRGLDKRTEHSKAAIG